MKVLSMPKGTSVCDLCGAELGEIDISETTVGWLGARYVTCPVCGYKENMVDGLPEVYLTPETIVYPTHFRKVSHNAVHIKEDRVMDYISELAGQLDASDKEYDTSFTGSGDLMVFGFRAPEALTFIETHDYEEGELPLTELCDISPSQLTFYVTRYDGPETDVNALIAIAADYFKANPYTWVWYNLSDDLLVYIANICEDDVLEIYITRNFKIHNIPTETEKSDAV